MPCCNRSLLGAPCSYWGISTRLLHSKRDARSLCQGVRNLAPKTKRVAVQLRGSNGQLLSPPQQAALLLKHYETVYANTMDDPPRASEMPPLQLSEVDLKTAIIFFKTHKAVPAHLAPIAAWKLCAAELIPPLLQISNRLTAAPELWRSAWWALIPKVTKPTLPKHLRPIGISEVSSRIIGKVLQGRLRPYVEAYLPRHTRCCAPSPGPLSGRSSGLSA